MGRISALLGDRDANVAVALTAYGAALGAAAVPVALIARPDPRLHVPEHLSATATFYVALAGALAGAAFVWPVMRRLPESMGGQIGPFAWLILTALFSLVVPFFSGMLIPFTVVLMNAQIGIIDYWNIPGQMLNSLFRMPIEAFVYGSLAIYTGFIAGVLFGVGGYVVNTLSYSKNEAVHRYAPWAISLTVGLFCVAFAIFGPPDLINRLG